MNKHLATALVLALSASLRLFAEPPSEIVVDLKLDEISYVSGERIRGVLDVRNMSPDKVSVGYTNSLDRLFVEVYRASDKSQLERFGRKPFTSRFFVKPNEGQKLETFLGDHYALTEPRRYLARPVLVHGGMRYEGMYRAFDVVPGMRITGALQMFSNRAGLSREFELVHWTRQGGEHIFLTARDHGTSERKWISTDIGPMMRITKPTISILPNGEVIVFHRNGSDSYVRSLFWSLPDALEFRGRSSVLDPATAGTQSVRELYREGGVKPKQNPWWKFW